MNYWQNKKVLISGGSSGLGRALALQLQQREARVAVIARGEAALQRLAIEHPGIHTIVGDVAEKRQVHRIHAEALARLVGIDILVNNASALGPTPLRLLLDTECEDFSKVLESNVLGPFRLSKLVLPGMILLRKGLVLNISSDAAQSAYPRWGAYGVSKAALDHLSRIFQAELDAEKFEGVRFLALDPGDMDTPLHRAAVPDADRAALKRPETAAEQLIEWIANDRILFDAGTTAAVRGSLS